MLRQPAPLSTTACKACALLIQHLLSNGCDIPGIEEPSDTLLQVLSSMRHNQQTALVAARALLPLYEEQTSVRATALQCTVSAGVSFGTPHLVKLTLNHYATASDDELEGLREAIRQVDYWLISICCCSSCALSSCNAAAVALC
jgi:hypothetical protein